MQLSPILSALHRTELRTLFASDDGANTPKVIAAQHWHVVEHQANLHILPRRIAEHLEGRADGEWPRLRFKNRSTRSDYLDERLTAGE